MSKKKTNTQQTEPKLKGLTFEEYKQKYGGGTGSGLQGVSFDEYKKREQQRQAERTNWQNQLLQKQERANNPEYYDEYAINWWDKKNSGAFTGSNPLLRSEEDIKKEKSIAQDNYIRAKKQENIAKSRTEKQTEDLKQGLRDASEWQGKLGTLSNNGIPMFDQPNASGGRNVYSADTDELRALNPDYYIKNRPEDYDDYRIEYDRYLYDYLFGNGEYDKRIDALETDEDDEALDAELDKYWNAMDNGTIQDMYSQAMGEYSDKSAELFRNDYGSEKYRKQIDKLTEEEKRMARIREMESDAPMISSQYDESKVKTEKVEDSFLNNYARPFTIGMTFQTGDEVDKLYQKVGDPFNPVGNPLTFGNLKDSDLANLANADPAYFMTPTQRNTFIKYYNAGMKDEAKAYYEALEPYLKILRSDYTTGLQIKMSTNEWAPMMVGMRIATQPTAGVLGTIGAAEAALGVEGAGDINNELYTLTRANQTIQSARAEEWGKKFKEWFGDTQFAENAGKFLNGVLYSVADNLHALAIGAGAAGSVGAEMSSKLAEGVIQLVMSTEATAETMVEKLENNVDPTEAALYAFGSGLIEAITEKYSIEAMLKPDAKDILKNIKAFGGYVAKNTAIEGAEEVGSDILEAGYDAILSAIYGHETELMKEKNQLMADNEGMTDEEASRQVLLNFMGKMGTDFLAGSLSGLMMSGTRGVYERGKTFTQSGAQVNAESNTVDGQTGIERLVEGAAGMEGTESQKMAQGIKADMEKGKKPSNYQTGQLAISMMNETDERYANVTKETLERNIRNQMTDAGIPDNVAKDAAAAIANGIRNNGKLTAAELSAIAKDKRAIQVWESFNSNPEKVAAVAKDIEEATEPQRSIADLVGDLTGRTAKGTGALAEDINAANRESDSNEAAVDNLQGRISGIISERYAAAAKTLLQTTTTLQKSKTFLDDIMKIRLAAYGLRTVMPKTNLDAESAQTLWNEAKAEFADEEKNRVVRQTTVTPGEGTATYNGASYGTGGWAQAVNGDKTLTGRQKLYMHTVAEIAKRMGMAVNFINEAGVQRVTSKTGEVSEINMEDVYGSEDQATGAVTVNIAGLDNNRMTHNAVVTVAHEFTHWLEQNSRNGYAALRQFVFDELRLQGTDVETELIRSINIQDTVLGAESGESLDLYGAVAEVVARSSEGLFTSAEMRNRLAQQDEGLYNKVKNFVRQFAARLNAAIKGIDRSLSREARTLKAKVDEIAKLWLEGYEEALNRPIEGTEPAEGTRMSTADRETGTLLKDAAAMAADEHPAVTVDTKNSLVTVWGKNVTTAPNTNVRYSVADNKTIRTLKMMADERILNDRTEMKKLLSKYNIKAETGRMAESSVMDYAGTVSKADLKKLQQLQSDIERWQQRMTEYDSIDENDPVAKYMAAWNQADMEAMQEILDSTMLSTPGVIPFKAAGWYNGDAHYSYYANAIKERDPAAIMVAAAEMAEFVPDNAVLIPIPNRNGQVTENTDTMLLARAIAQLKGVPVVNALAGQERMSRKEAKKSGVKQTAEDLGFRKVADIPEGTVPYFIDNVVGTGVTAKAAHDAFGTGITLAYAKSTRAAIDGLKWSKNEIYGKGPMQFVRPLDQRADLSMTGVSGVRYSIKDMQKLTWEQQMDRAFSGKAHANDVYVILDAEDAADIGITAPIALRQSIFTKGKRTKQDNASRSAHELTKKEYLKLKDSIKNPVARIENRGSVYIVTDQYKEQREGNETERKQPIVLVGQYKNEFLKGGVLDTATIGGRNNVSTLFGKFADGKFVYDKGAKIYQYKNNAVDILSLSPSQFGAGPDVYDAIETLTQENEKGKKSFSVAQKARDDSTEADISEEKANDILESTGEIAYTPARYSFAGFNAASGYGSDARRAAEMAEEGATEEEIREETNCIKGYNGRWWRILDNNSMHLKYTVDFLKRGTADFGEVDPFRLSDIYNAKELYLAYPQLKNAEVYFTDREEDYFGSASPEDMRITINTRYDRGIEDIEATLQHEIQHLIQYLEGSNRGASVTYWKDMQDIAKARLANNDREITRIYDKYGIDESRELAFGIGFNEDGTLDEEWLFPEELEKVRKFSEEDLTKYRNISEDNRKWSRIVDGIGPRLLYRNTVGEIEARAASEKTGPETKIRYPEDAVTTEEYSGRRFSMNQNVEVNEDGLIAYHNIAENQMLAAMRLGGFPMPSIAITRTNYANNRYGGISVVFYPGTIDPGVSKWNKVYGSDAWTPTYPTVSYKLSSKAFDRLQKRIYKLVPESVRNGLQYQAFDIENLENNVNGRRGDAAAAVGDTILFKLAYLNDKGIKYDLPQREKALDGFGNFKNDQVIRVAEVLGEDAVREAHDGGFEYIREHEELAGQVAQILNDQWREKHKDIALKIAKMDLYDKNKFGTNRIYELMEAADRYLSQGVESALDQYKMQDIADSLIDQEDYQAWLKEQTRDLIEKKGIRNNKDFYTNSGNRRSWDALHDEETLENVVKVMRAQTQKGEASMFSQSDLLAIGTKDFRTLEQIRKDKGRLMHITDEEMSELKTDIVNRVSELQDELKDRSEHNDFIARDRALQAIVSAVRRYKSAAGIESELRVWRGLHVTTGMGQRILDIMKDISELPTEYFEAKPMRAVGFEEIAEVILPEGTSQELIDGLNEKNIAWKYYDGTEEGRLKALNSVEGVQFSVRQQDMEVSRFMLGLNENNMTTAQEKTMVRQFKELDAALRIERHALNDRTRRLRELEAKQNQTAFDREEMRKLRNRIEINNKKIDRLESQMIKATSEEGYARLMYQQEQNMRNTVSGRTSEEVRATIEALTKQVTAVTKEIETRQKDIDSMRDDLTFRKTSALVDSSAAEKVAAMIRKMYNSRINKQDLIRAMTEIRLKIAAGKNIDAEAEELAWKILSEATMDGGESLKRLRGTVIKLGKGQVKELMGSNSSLKELRSIFAGSGIQVRSAKDGEVGLDGGSWEELCNIAPELDRNATELEQVNELIRFVQNQKQQMSGAEQYRDNIDEVVMDLKGWIASIGVNTPQDPGAMKILESMNKLVNEMATGIAGSAEKLNTAKAQLADLVDQGKLAISMTDKMQREVEQAIRYNNTLAEQSEAALWKSEKWKLIEQLKSENTQNLLKEQEKWKEKIAKDKQARQMMQSNQQLRKMIHTNVTRVARLIFNETDVKNMPEHMKGLAREMLEMIMRNDVNGRKITGINRKDLLDNLRTLDIIRKQDGGLDMDDIAQIHDAEAQSVVLDALADIEDGIKYYNASTGKDIISNLQAFHNALDRIAEAVANITNVIHAEQSINLGDRRVAITDAANEIIYDMSRSRFKGEMRGRGSKAINATKGSVVYGNTTPVYFFKNLLNRGMMKQWAELKRGQNRNGLETQKAADFMQDLANRTNYKAWADQKYTVTIGNRKLELTIGNIMEIYAIWKREQISKDQYPEMSSHMEVGGIFIDEDTRTEGKLHREKQNLKAMRVNKADVDNMYGLLTAEQKQYLDEVVGYLSNQMSDLGNEASMRMYGIKKYKESWYFPMRVWDGVKSARSDKGISGTNENRAAHKGWSKRRKNNASNALVIGDFTRDAVSHIAEMINYNTMAPVIENFNKILNFQTKEIDETGVQEGDEYFVDVETPIVKRSLRIMFEEAYGKQALNYLETFLKDLNGGMIQDQRSTLRDRMISVFRKNAVAGSLSVALQQPLSYIRAAMMISPKHLAQAISPTYWKGSHAEMNKYSGVAVIKDMGRFDMNFGQSAKDYISPDTKVGKYEWVSDKLTILPELMDRMTWTRMWSAVKLEQHELHPEMDMKSDAFLNMVAERFNDVMMATQVYDSVLVKSSNMRSTNPLMKVITSFMAEPTLTLNVLSDAVLNVKEKGGKAMLAKAGATFALGAVLQALMKGLMGSGRTPDEKKTWWENFLNKWAQNFISEIDPLNLIPGYSDLVEVLKKGELKDDAMGMLGKVKTAFETGRNALQGKGKGAYRDIEDSAAQIAQMFTNIPYKNIMRDMRAMYNWFSGSSYAKRDTSGAVIKYQTEAAALTADNMLGVLNTWLGDAGFKTTNKAYYGRMFDAVKNGNQAEAEGIREYLKLAKGIEEKDINGGVKAAAKDRLKAVQISETEYQKYMKKVDPSFKEEDLFWDTDRIKYQEETGKKVESNEKYYRLWDAMDGNKANDIGTAITLLMKHGVEAKSIKSAITSQYKAAYLAADSAGKRRIRDAIQKAYRKMGLTAEDASKVIDGWVKDSKKK